MKRQCTTPTLLEISDIYVDGSNPSGFFTKETLHDYVKEHPGSIKVFIEPYPALIPVISTSGEKYVKSTPNSSRIDNLLSLPRS
jgi:hypothetical protein